MHASWTLGDPTNSKYRQFLNLWQRSSYEESSDPFHPSLNLALKFLMNMKESGQKYGAINNARSEFSSITNNRVVSFGKIYLVCQFMKGICNNEAPNLKYEEMWDPDLVLNYISCIADSRDLNLKNLTSKTFFKENEWYKFAMKRTLEAVKAWENCQTSNFLFIS